MKPLDPSDLAVSARKRLFHLLNERGGKPLFERPNGASGDHGSVYRTVMTQDGKNVVPILSLAAWGADQYMSIPVLIGGDEVGELDFGFFAGFAAETHIGLVRFPELRRDLMDVAVTIANQWRWAA